MKVFTLVFMVLAAKTTQAVPLSMVMNSPGIINPNSIDEGPNGDDDDDFTTHTLERLSSAATCLVAGVEYTHGQQIYRRDQCEFCLCLDGEMFCWWQECPPAMEGPCKGRGPFSPCQNGLNDKQPPSDSKTTAKTTTPVPPTSSTRSQSSVDTEVSASTDFSDESSTEMTDYTSTQESVSPSSSTETPTFCMVMGRKYNIGDRLPHDTGNCVECICGAGAQITCSPHQCGPPGDDINDYRPPGLRSAQPDVF